MTIADVAARATLWEGDRLSVVYDFGTPSHYYCIVKEVYESDEMWVSERSVLVTDVIGTVDSTVVDSLNSRAVPVRVTV